MEGGKEGGERKERKKVCIFVHTHNQPDSPAALTVPMKTLARKARGTMLMLYSRNRTRGREGVEKEGRRARGGREEGEGEKEGSKGRSGKERGEVEGRREGEGKETQCPVLIPLHHTDSLKLMRKLVLKKNCSWHA